MVGSRFPALTLAAAMAIASGACVRKSTHQKVLDELEACQGNLGSCQTTRDEQAAKIGNLEQDLVDARAAGDAEAKGRRVAEQELAQLRQDLDTTEGELKVLRKQREAAEQRLAAFRELTDKFRSLVDTGKLEVVFRSGQMVLKLPAEILFASGKARLSRDGKEALGEVLQILLQFKDRRFMVAGHTDDQPIRTRRFKDNWELSTARALSVLEFMVEAGFDPKNLAAAGYGEYDPIAPNDTAEGRQLNRRIEIILVPDLSELPNLEGEPGS